MRKLHIKQGEDWLPVFCITGGKIITCEQTPSKALPCRAMWAEDDLKYFRSKFASHQFDLRLVEKHA